MNRLIADSVVPVNYRDNPHLDIAATAFYQGALKRVARIGADSPANELAQYCLQLKETPKKLGALCWHPEIGATLERLNEGKISEAALQAFFSLCGLGITGNWSVHMDAPVRLSMAGHIFDLRGHIEIQAEPDLVVVRNRSITVSPLQFCCSKYGWRLVEDERPDAAWRYAKPSFFDNVDFRSSYVQSWQSAASQPRNGDLKLNWPQQPVDATCDALADNVAQQMTEVFDLFSQMDANYLRWLKPVFRGIAACPSDDPLLRTSSSFPSHSGVISVAFPLSTVHLAEILVHESSHQYFMMLEASIPLIKREEASTQLYSSFKKRNRPLKMVFFAFHATANMAVFWHDLLMKVSSGDKDGQAELARLQEHVESLSAQIESSSGLTEAGITMFDSLRDVLKKRKILH